MTARVLRRIATILGGLVALSVMLACGLADGGPKLAPLPLEPLRGQNLERANGIQGRVRP